MNLSKEEMAEIINAMHAIVFYADDDNGENRIKQVLASLRDRGELCDQVARVMRRSIFVRQ